MSVSVKVVEVEPDESILFRWVNSQPRTVVESKETALAACIEALTFFRMGLERFEEEAKTERAVDWLNSSQVLCLKSITGVEDAEAIINAKYKSTNHEHVFDDAIRAEAKKFIDAN